jgi:hypothetical protein
MWHLSRTGCRTRDMYRRYLGKRIRVSGIFHIQIAPVQAKVDHSTRCLMDTVVGAVLETFRPESILLELLLPLSLVVMLFSPDWTSIIARRLVAAAY